MKGVRFKIGQMLLHKDRKCAYAGQGRVVVNGSDFSSTEVLKEDDYKNILLLYGIDRKIKINEEVKKAFDYYWC